MKKPLVITALLVVLIAAAAIFFGRRKPTATPARDTPTTGALRAAPSPGSTANTAVATTATKTDVAIQDGKTLDFSSGKPVLKDSADEKAIIEQSLKEMNEAAASVTFGPVSKTPATDTKKPAPQE